MKKWYKSKTLWVNLISMVAILAQSNFKKDVLLLETQTSLLGIVNLILRVITKEQIDWNGGDKDASN
jgi:uncharacterized membrane protein